MERGRTPAATSAVTMDQSNANASETEPARLIAYIIADDGAEHTVYDK